MKTLMIPTTAGTGSEATPNAIVAVPEKQLKVGIVNTEMIADYVILDAVMIKSCLERLPPPPVWTLWPTPSSALPATRPIPSATCSPSRPWI